MYIHDQTRWRQFITISRSLACFRTQTLHGRTKNTKIAKFFSNFFLNCILPTTSVRSHLNKPFYSSCSIVLSLGGNRVIRIPSWWVAEWTHSEHYGRWSIGLQHVPCCGIRKRDAVFSSLLTMCQRLCRAGDCSISTSNWRRVSSWMLTYHTCSLAMTNRRRRAMSRALDTSCWFEALVNGHTKQSERMSCSDAVANRHQERFLRLPKHFRKQALYTSLLSKVHDDHVVLKSSQQIATDSISALHSKANHAIKLDREQHRQPAHTSDRWYKVLNMNININIPSLIFLQQHLNAMV